MINTYSSFYTVDEVTSTNYYVDFDEGGSEISFTLTLGAYTLTTLASELQNKLNENGGQTYTVTIDRSTRKYTIAASSNFTLRVTTGTHVGTSAFSLLGFSSNQTGSNSYESQSEVGTSYEPQFYLQDYISPDDWKEAVDESVNQSATGVVEVVSFGQIQYLQMNIRYANDYLQGGAFIKNNASGVSDLRTFMSFIIQKLPFEFVPDIDSPSSFYKVLLESTSISSQGTGFRLKELYDQSLPGYYETGVLKLRIVS